MKQPKVTVIIPVYNTQNYVRATVESIVAQQLTDIQIIIINDGSTDNSLSIIQTLAGTDPRITIIDQPNGGPSLARNTGMRHATGEFIYFIDSDDMLGDDALLKCYTKCTEEQLDFVLFDAECFDDNGHIVDGFSQKRPSKLTSEIYSGLDALRIQVDAYAYNPSACMALYRSRFLHDNDLWFYPGILHEDQLFSIKAHFCARRVAVIHEALYKRRIRENSIMTTRYAWRNFESYTIVARQLQMFIADRQTAERKVMKRYLTQMLNAAIWQGHNMPLRQRLRAVAISLRYFRRYLRPKTIAALLFKSYTR